jgi:hypothetical protein
MSVIRPIEQACPACGAPLRVGFADSVNGARQPDLRAAILDDSFQRVRCETCGAASRIDPALTYLDVERNQWMLVRPAGNLAEWEQFEAQAREIHALAFGTRAGASARRIGARLSVRVTFGWPAAREKLLCAAHGIDDVELELLKLGLVRWLGDTPIDDDIELRCTAVQGDALQLVWLRAASGEAIESLSVPRRLLDDVARDQAGFGALRKTLGAATFVDLHRLLVEPA